ncbi:MAG: hypothetical protein IJD33_01120 [Clostridia bacterium]|nr:hypothetical protein [Clostridia bacterium]
MEEKKKEEKIGEALLKVALGYQVSEVTEEYAEVDGTLKLTKRKKTKKDVPPDLKAVQMLLTEDGGGGFVQWSDEDLETEKARLMALLKDTEREKKTVVKNAAVKKTTAKKPAAKKRTAVKKETKKNGRNGNDV